jgi:predicted MarR family transcription regulator
MRHSSPEVSIKNWALIIAHKADSALARWTVDGCYAAAGTKRPPQA